MSVYLWQLDHSHNVTNASKNRWHRVHFPICKIRVIFFLLPLFVGHFEDNGKLILQYTSQSTVCLLPSLPNAYQRALPDIVTQWHKWFTESVWVFVFLSDTCALWTDSKHQVWIKVQKLHETLDQASCTQRTRTLPVEKNANPYAYVKIYLPIPEPFTQYRTVYSSFFLMHAQGFIMAKHTPRMCISHTSCLL